MRKPEEIKTAFADVERLSTAEGFFLVGIGGAGMSALARMFKDRGMNVRGSDSTQSSEIDRLRSEGIECWVGHTAEHISPSDAVILSDAIDLDRSPEVDAARNLGVPILRRSQALGWLLKPYKVVAVTGTHGKTTTTGMLGASLIAAGLDPLVVVGAAIPQWSGPIREGQGQFAVVEACEAYDSFHDLDPFVVVLTNLELDHRDYHGTYENLRNSVVRFVDKIPPEGWLVYCSEDRGASEVAELSSARAVPYGASDDWQKQIANRVGAPFGDLRPFPQGSNLALPGRHNLLNAAGAMTAAAVLKADLDKVENALRVFGGAERRLQVIQEAPIVVIDDYAHHPSEITASLEAVRERYFVQNGRKGRLIAVFQPHLYSRTDGQYAEFAAALDLADEIVLTDIYPARERPIPGVSSSIIAELVTKPVHYVPSRFLLPRQVGSFAQEGDVVVAMGAGTIGEFGRAFVSEVGRRNSLREGARKLKVAVLYGGESAEREVSLHSGMAAQQALLSLGYEAVLVDVTDLLLQGRPMDVLTGPDRPDVAFLALHGTGAEDGAIQGFLELLHIPYTGSGILASAVCMDKAATKKVLEREGIRTPRGQVLESSNDAVGIEAPLIVKPNSQGSTVGLTFVLSDTEVAGAIQKAFAYDNRVLVEEWIRGIEISTPVLSNKALTPVEIVPVSGRYDFASKYVPGATKELVPARIGEDLLLKAQQIALQAHKALGCRGATRTDAIVSGNEIVVLEVNTLPGLTPTSLLPNSAAYGGIDFQELCRTIVEDALQAHGTNCKANAHTA